VWSACVQSETPEESDQLCEALGIEHRPTQPSTPRTNGMVERFNGRIKQALRTHHVKSGEEVETTLLRGVWLYNQHWVQKDARLRIPGSGTRTMAATPSTTLLATGVQSSGA